MAGLRRDDVYALEGDIAPERPTTLLAPEGPVSESQRAIELGLQNLRSQGLGLRALGNALIGDDEAATDFALRSQGVQQRAAERGPRVQSWSRDVNGVGDALEFVRNTALSEGPGMAATLVGGPAGIGGRLLLRQGAKKVAGKLVKESAEESLKRNTRAAAAGAYAASVPQIAGANAGENLTMDSPDERTMRERALATWGTAGAAGTLDVLPAMRVLRRAGLLGKAAPELNEQAGRVLTRIAKESGKQALYEGFTETGQAVIERLGQKWIDRNLNLLSPDEFRRYVDAFAAGAALGGTFGGAAEGVGVARERMGKVSLPPRIKDALLRRRTAQAEAQPGDTFTDKVARNEQLLQQANDDLDFLFDDDFADEDNDFSGYSLVPGAVSPSPEASASRLEQLLADAPRNVQMAQRLLTAGQASPELLARADQTLRDYLSQRESADEQARVSARAERIRTQQMRELEALLSDGNNPMAEAIGGDPALVGGALSRLFSAPAKPLASARDPGDRSLWTPQDSLLSAVRGRGSLDAQDVALIQRLDQALASDPAAKARLRNVFAGANEALSADDEARYQRDMADAEGPVLGFEDLRDARERGSVSRAFGRTALGSAARNALLSVEDVERQQEGKLTEGFGRVRDSLRQMQQEVDAELERRGMTGAAFFEARSPEQNAERRSAIAEVNRAALARLPKDAREFLQTQAALDFDRQLDNPTLLEDLAGMDASENLRSARELELVQVADPARRGETEVLDLPQAISSARSRMNKRSKGVPSDRELLDAFATVLLAAREAGYDVSGLAGRGEVIVYRDAKGNVRRLRDLRPDQVQTSDEVDPDEFGQETAGREANGDQRVPDVGFNATEAEALGGLPAAQLDARTTSKAPRDDADRFSPLERGAEGVEGIVPEGRRAGARAEAREAAASQPRRSRPPQAPVQGRSAASLLDPGAPRAPVVGPATDKDQAGANVALRSRQRGQNADAARAARAAQQMAQAPRQAPQEPAPTGLRAEQAKVLLDALNGRLRQLGELASRVGREEAKARGIADAIRQLRQVRAQVLAGRKDPSKMPTALRLQTASQAAEQALAEPRQPAGEQTRAQRRAADARRDETARAKADLREREQQKKLPPATEPAELTPAKKGAATKDAKKMAEDLGSKAQPKVKLQGQTLEQLQAQLARDEARAQAEREYRATPVSETIQRSALNQMRRIYDRAAAYVETKFKAHGATRGQLAELQTLFTQYSRGAIDAHALREGVDRVFPAQDTANKSFRDWVASQMRGKPPSLVTLNKLANAAVAWLGVKAKVKVRYAVEGERIGFGFATRQANGVYEVVLAPVQRGANLYSTLAHEIGHIVKWEAFDKASQAERDAILKAYNAWLEANNSAKQYAADVIASRATAARQQQLLNYGVRGKTLADLSPDERAYALNFDEWFSDQVARYLTTERAATSLVAKFFKQVARQLVQLAQAFGARAAPDKAVARFLDAMSPDKAVRDAVRMEAAASARVDASRLPEGVSSQEAAAAVNSATAPGAAMTVWSIADTFRRLPEASKRLVQQMVRRGPVLRMLRSKVSDPRILAAMEHPATADETRLAVAFELWRRGELKLAQAQGPFRTVWDKMLKQLRLLTKTDYFEQLLVDVHNGRLTGRPQTYSAFKRAAKDANAAAKTLAALNDYYLTSVVPVANRIFAAGVGERMMDSGIPAMVEFALALKLPTGARGQTDVGLFQARLRAAHQLNTRMGHAIEGLDEDELNELTDVLMQTKDVGSLPPKLREAHAKVREHLDKAYEYLAEAGVQMGNKQNYYPVVMLEPDQLSARKDEFIEFFSKNFEDAMRTKLFTVISKGLSPTKQRELEAELAKRDARSLAESFFDMAMGEPPGAMVDWERGARPSFRYMNEQLMDFVLAGTPEQRATFATFREPNLAYTLARYNEAAAKRAEFQRRFPDNEALADYFARAKAQGATDAQVELMHDYLDVMMGNYGLQYPTALKHVLGGIDKVFGSKLADNPQTLRNIQGFILVYNNLRLLGLATLSSIVDSVGIAVRTGRFNDVFRAYRDSFRAIRKNGGMQEAWRLAEDLGAVETTVTNEALAMAYGGLHLTRTARRVNDFFFQAIGLTRWTQATRVASIAMAERFIIRHVERPNQHSARYLDELGLTRDDVTVVVDPDGSEHVALNEKTRRALLQFMDEAILRPDPSQRPLWMSDPNYVLLSQYKSFVYAFQQTILKRIGVEFREGNYQPLMLTMAYLPIMLASELLREILQHGFGGDERREEWGATDYLLHSTERTGLLGPREFVLDAAADPNYGNLPGASFLGPTASHARSWLSDKPTSAKVVETLPANSVWKHHLPVGSPVTNPVQEEAK